MNQNYIPYPIKVYKDAATSTHKAYNSFVFEFSPNEDTTSGINMGIELNLSPGTPIL